MAVGTLGVTRVVKVDVVPIVGEMATSALAGPMAAGWGVTTFAIGKARMVKNYVVPTGTGNVAC